MNLLLISILAVASLSLLPTKTHGTTEVQEPPQALPLAAQTQPTNGAGAVGNAGIVNNGGEIWQEDDREVLIRNERGAKNNGNGAGSGKRGKNKKNKNPIETTKEPTVQDTEPHEKHENAGGKDDLNQEQKQQHQQLAQEQHQTHNKHSNKHGIKKAHSEDNIPSSCRYVKSPWTECDAKSNTRSRTLTLKKGEAECVPTRTIQKKCKKEELTLLSKDQINKGADGRRATRDGTTVCSIGKKRSKCSESQTRIANSRLEETQRCPLNAKL